MLHSAIDYFPQNIPTRRPRIWWLVSVCGSLLFVSLIIAAPLFAAHGDLGLAANIYHPFGFICHQLPERSFFISGHKLAVCSRCTGLYFGFTATLLIYPLFRSLRVVHTPHRKWLIAAAVPLFIDFLLTFVGVWENTHSTRFVTGFVLGSVVVFYVMPAVVELSMRSWSKTLPIQETAAPVRKPLAVGPSDYSAPERRI
jgi:uncharacterized membrane protein